MRDLSGAKITTVREMTVQEFAKFVTNEVNLAFERMTRNCENCGNFIHDSQLCALANEMPPPKIAIHGCEKFEEIIPF